MTRFRKNVYCVQANNRSSAGSMYQGKGEAMEMKEVRTIAKKRGVLAAGMGKADLIRAIQRAEGNFDCYGTATEEVCDQEGCLWREDCLFDSTGEEIREPFMGGVRT